MDECHKATPGGVAKAENGRKMSDKLQMVLRLRDGDWSL
jgi:hypothetical protein